jgi:hypothetical protein
MWIFTCPEEDFMIFPVISPVWIDNTAFPSGGKAKIIGTLLDYFFFSLPPPLNIAVIKSFEIQKKKKNPKKKKS